MKKLYKIPWQCCRGLKKAALTAFLLFGATQIVTAQVSGYTFSQNNGTFTSIASTGTIVTGSEASNATTNDTAGWSETIPFNFNFNGTNYTSIYVNSNGGATFGTTTSSAASVISSTTAFAGAIGVMSRDLWGMFVTTGITTSGSPVITSVVSMKGIEVGKTLNNVNGIPTGATVTAFDDVAGTITMSANATSSSAAAVVRYGTGKIVTSTVGTAPNRVFVIEWIGYNDYGTTATVSNYLNFQLRLTETTNSVSIVYGPQYNVSTTSRTNQIGLRGATNADYNNRLGAVANPWTATAAGTSNSSSVSRDNTNFPASGLTFSWAPPTCIAPGTFVYSNLTTTSVDLAWTASITVPANGYEVYYSTTNTAPTASTVLDATNSVTSATTTATISGLTPSTTYYVWVRSVCSASDISGWNSAGSFSTNCGAVTTLSENFDSYTTGSIVPLCWARMVPATTPGSQTITSTTPASGTRNIFLSTTATQTPVIVALPEFSNVNAGTHRLKFKARVTAAPGSLSVGYVTDIFDNNSFVLLQDLIINNIVYTSGADYTVIPPTTVPAGARLAIKTTSSDAKSYYFDDVVWEAIPSCLAPVSPSITGATTSSLNIAWTAPSTAPANGYDVYYTTTNTAPTGATVLDGTNSVTSATTAATITGLTANTVYYIWVRSNCNAADQSVWVSAGSANTGYCVPSAVTTTYYITSFTSTGATTNINYTAAAPSATGYTNVSATSKISNFVGSVTPITLSMGPSSNAGFAVWVDWNNNLIFETTERVYVTTGYVTTTSGATITVPAATALGSYRMRVVMDYSNSAPSNPCGTTGSTDYVDATFEVVAPPTCLAPSGVMAASTSTTSATVSWTAPTTAPANGYEIYYSTTNTAPTAATPPTVTGITGTSTTISSLADSSTYYVWVRSNCSPTDKSAWSMSATFNTPCPATSAPYTMDFSSATAPDLPNCTNVTQNGAGNVWATLATGPTGFTGPVLSYLYNTTNAADTWFFTQGMNMNAGTTYYIGYKYANNGSTTYVERMKVGIGMGNNAAAMTTTIADHPNINSTTPTVVQDMMFTPTVSGVYYLGFQAYSIADRNRLYLDDITVTTITLGITDIVKDDRSFSIAPNPFTDVVRISDVKDVVSISIVDLSGRIVKTVKPAREINLGDLKTGMYLINMKMKDGSVQTVKAIKK